jgi:hypothetical protein
MAEGDFNQYASPKAKTQRFKMYVDVSENNSEDLELQGRGITSWTTEQNQDVEQEEDVLGYVDNTRGNAKPQQSIDTFKFRKDSKLGKIVFDAFFSGDQTRLDNITIYQKFEFVDGTSTGTCKARKLPNSMINITSFNGEAGSDLSVAMDIYYSGEIITGTMPITDGASPTFTPDSGASVSAYSLDEE